jgi:hypothetical protein
VASWSVPYCRACKWRHDAADPCDPTRLSIANAERDADVKPGQFIADTPRTWSQERSPGTTISEADAFYRAHARVK